jgi:hypothetical protein
MAKKFLLAAAVAIVVSAAVFLSQPDTGAQSAPAKPDLKSATSISACAVRLEWSQPDNADKFEFKLAGTDWSVIPQVSGSGDKTFNHTQLSPGGNYTYQIRAFRNIGGYSEPSNARSAQTPSLENPPTPPTNLSVVRWESKGGRVVLSWTPSEDKPFSGFRIYRSDNGGLFNAVATVSLDDFKRFRNEWSDAVDTDSGTIVYKIKTYQTDNHCAPVDNATPENASWVKFSPNFSAELTIPQRPASLTEKETRNNRTEARFQWSNVASETDYELQVSEQENFSAGVVNYSYGRDVTVSDWITFAPNQTFYLRLRACNSAGGNSGCSAYVSSTYRSDYIGPAHLKASVASINAAAQTATVNLSWDDLATYERKIIIYRNTAEREKLGPIKCTGSPPVCSYPRSYQDENVPLNFIYEYKVTFLVVSENKETTPSIDTLNLNVTPIHGWAWSGHGLGWIRLSHNSISSSWGPADQTADSQQYGVFIDNTGLLSGYAWSPYAGWLSFNDEGCPAGFSNCQPQVNPVTGLVTSFAKFIKNSEGSGLDKWVSLSQKTGEPAYKLGYATTTEGTATIGNLRGFAWGGDVVGWITFGGPILKKVEVVPQVGTSLNITWENPIDYQKVEIYTEEKGTAASSKKERWFFSPVSETRQGDNKQATITGLKVNTEYDVWVRGYPQ